MFDLNKKKNINENDLNIDESINTENTKTTTTSKNKNININNNVNVKTENNNNQIKKEETIKIINHGQFVEKERNKITIDIDDIDENEIDNIYDNMFDSNVNEDEIINNNNHPDHDIEMKKSEEDMKIFDEIVNDEH